MEGYVFPSQSFIIVKYGANQEAIFNPWCASNTFIEWIRKRCRCDKNLVLDLIDLDGDIKHLSSRENPRDYAADLVNSRETYVLISIEKPLENEPAKYVPLLENLESFSPDLMAKLDNLMRPTTRGKRDLRKKMGQKLALPKSREISPNKRPTSSDRRTRQKPA